MNSSSTLRCIQRRWVHVTFVFLSIVHGAVAEAESPIDAERVAITRPLRHAVFQRRFDVPQWSHANHPGGPAKGFAEVECVIELPWQENQQVSYRILGARTESPWVRAPSEAVTSTPTSSNATKITVPVDAGGWYSLDIRILLNGEVIGEGTSEPFGVGDVFLVAGQSYATNCNDELLKVADAQQRVVAYDFQAKSWRLGDDPQPTGDHSDGGSIWPIVGDHLVNAYEVPVGFVNVAVGATSTSQWQIDGPFFHRLISAGKEMRDFRAVLWQQGESDVLEKTSTATYTDRLVAMRNHTHQAWGSAIPWILAKSTLHPTVYNDPIGEANIRQAIENLIVHHGFLRGPDTDRLAGENRGPMSSRRHFTGLGQRNAASMWYAAFIEQLDAPKPQHHAYVAKLRDLHLRQPPWRSPEVFHESAILLHEDNLAPTLRLAFPAEEILEVRAAWAPEQRFPETHWEYDRTKSQLKWIGPLPCEAVLTSQLFMPEGTPNSYKHRVGMPEQNLLYQPGKWFHERNLEITYRRANLAEPFAPTPPSGLSRTLSRLRNKEKVMIAVSGDSISTGLDASGTTASLPYQPGYPELVAAQLTKDFSADVHLVNRSVAGWSIANGLQDLDELLKSQPDLLIVAYGMNDVGRRDPQWFADQAEQLQTRARTTLPEIEILWVTPMLGNREWVHTPRPMFFAYRDALQGIVKPGDAVADVTHVWDIMTQNKHDLDLTGNGLNHPNDYGHRLYAQTILEFLPAE